VAEVDIVAPNAPLPPGKADAVLRFGETAAREQATKLLLESIGPCAEGATSYGLVARPLDQINAVHLVLQADVVPTSKALDEFLSASFSHFEVAPVGSNGFRVSLKSRFYTAAEYLALSQPAVPDLDLLRKALERPCARMDSDYQRPFGRPIPNFVRMRTVAQMLAQRTQCYLLLGQPEAAWHELELVRGVCYMLEAKPASDCPTLVEAMIDVAITGLYTSIVQDGLRLRVWRESELVAMQQQLAEVNLLPLLHKSFETGRAGTCRAFEATPPAELKKLFAIGRSKQTLWDKLQDPTYLLLTFAPRGWKYQNMCAGAPREQTVLEALDLPTNQVLPGKLERMEEEIIRFGARRSPYTFLAAIALPNFVKATQTMARNQTLANEAYVACGLERYRLAHGQYPETLEALVPQFAAKLPHDVIGGQALKYGRTAEGRFVLYSVGWNERDDGGAPGKTVAEGDWVWP
jgi:Tfp pilus assembly protein PilE